MRIEDYIEFDKNYLKVDKQLKYSSRFDRYLETNKIFLTVEQATKIIEGLKYENEINKYEYKSFPYVNAVVIVLLTSYITVCIKSSDVIGFNRTGGILFGVSWIYIGCIVSIEVLLVQCYALKKKKKYHRLIRVLENYIINKLSPSQD